MKFSIFLIGICLISSAIAGENKAISKVSGFYRVAASQPDLCDIGIVEVKEEKFNSMKITSSKMFEGSHEVGSINEPGYTSYEEYSFWSNLKAKFKNGVLKEIYKQCTGASSLCLLFEKGETTTYIEFKNNQMTIHGSIVAYGQYENSPMFTPRRSVVMNRLICTFDFIKE